MVARDRPDTRALTWKLKHIMAAKKTPCQAQSPIARILVVEDHPIVREGYSQLIGTQTDLEVCAFASSEQEAIEQIKATHPDLAVIDLTLKDSHGMELIKQVAIRFPKIRMLVISAHDENVFAERAVDAGALGYINKQQATEQLIEGIRRVLQGEFYLSEATTKRILERRLHRHPNDAPSPIAQLSDRELEVFEYIGHGMATRQIATKMHVSPKTVERYRENIKAKLKLASATELVQRATQWILEGG